MLVLKVKGRFTDETLPVLSRDQLLSNANGGVKFLFDAGFKYSYAGGAPTQGMLVRDISETADGYFNLSPGQTVDFSGNGFDFSTISSTTGGNDNNNVQAPNGVWDSIATQQYFLTCLYCKLPSAADWNTIPTIFPIFACSSGLSGSGYQTEPDVLTICQTAGSLSFRRQTAINSADALSVSAANHYGKLTQIAYWRNASGVGCRTLSADGSVSTAISGIGVNNGVDWSTIGAKFGVVPPFTSFNMAEHRTAKNFKLYRGFIENLHQSTRDPIRVLDDDMVRVLARKTFS